MMRVIKFHLKDLPADEFCILLEPEIQKVLVEGAAKAISLKTKRNYGKFKDLGNHLKNTCKSFFQVKSESISDVYIPNWKVGKKFIPIDCAIELCRLNCISTEGIEEKIIKIKYKLSANKNAISFNFLYDISFATIAEIIKADGHMKKNLTQCTIMNQNMEFIHHIKYLIRKTGVQSHNLYEYVRIEASVPHTKIQRIIDTNSKAYSFSIRHEKKKISFCDTTLKTGDKKTYKIILKDGKIIKLFVEIPLNSKIIRNSSYKTSSVGSCLSVTNITFVKILSLLFDVPAGKKSKIIRICPKIYDSPIGVKKSVIGAIFACEGWVEPRERRIRIYVDSKEYIKDLKKLLRYFGIIPTINRRGYLSISSRKDLVSFYKNFDLIIKEKNQKLFTILDTYEREILRRNEGLFRILQTLNKNNTLTAYQLADALKKHKDTIFFHLKNGIDKRLIYKNESQWPYHYSITPTGIIYMGDNHDMFRD